MGRLSENSVVNIKNRSHSVTADSRDPRRDDANGVIVAQGGAFGGWALYVKDGRRRTATTSSGCSGSRPTVTGRSPAGEHQIRMEFTYDGGGLAKGGTATLYVDGKKVGEGRVDSTEPMVFSGDETTDVGSDTATPVSDDYGIKDSGFTGRIELGPDPTSMRPPRTSTTSSHPRSVPPRDGRQ